MKAKKYTEEQIIAVLKEGEPGPSWGSLPQIRHERRHLLQLEGEVRGMTVSDLRRLKALEAENRRLKQIVAEQALDNLTLKELLSKNF